MKNQELQEQALYTDDRRVESRLCAFPMVS